MSENNTCYDVYEEKIREICSDYPDIPEKITFGSSYLGREISALRLGEGTHRILYIGGVTGALMTTELLLRFASDYADAVKNGRRICGIDISYLFHTREITVVPLLNPDGAILREGNGDPMNPLIGQLTERMRTRNPLFSNEGSGSSGEERTVRPKSAVPDFSTWECSGRGVDLRCNYDAQFDLCMQNGFSVGEAGYPGVRPESEPECAAVARFLRSAGGIDLGMQFLDGKPGERHGKIAWNPRGGTEYRTRTIAEILAGNCGYRLDETPVPGSLKDWYRGRNAGPFFEITCVREREEVSQAFLALRYGQLQKLLFHSAVL